MKNMDEPIFREYITKRIVDRARELGLRQSDIVKKIDVPKSTVNGWFTGTTMPNGMVLLSLCSALRCNVDWLLGGIGAPAADLDTVTFDSVPGVWEVRLDQISSYYRLPALNDDLQIDNNNCKLLAHSALTKNKLHFAWLNCNDNASAPAININDFVVVDTSCKKVVTSGCYYAIKTADSIRVHQIHTNFDGSLSVVDSSRGDDHIKVLPQNITIAGLVVYRSGSL